MSKERRDLDFFPLTVDFIEKMYAVGRIPGGYLKREARPSEKGTLTARLVDRPIRPSFPDGMRNDVHIVITTLSCDQVNQPDVISIMGASAALMVGGVPIEGPVAGVRIARAKAEDGSIDYIVNPTFEEAEASDLNLTVAGTKEYISMVEAGADEVCEADMIAALEFAQEAIGAFCDEQQKFLDKCTIEPKTYELDQPIPEVVDKVDGYYAAMEAALKDADKQSRIAKVEEEDDSLQDEPVLTNEDLVLGIRPEFLNITSEAPLKGEIYGAMPTGMESTIKVYVNGFLLTGVVFGSSLFTIGEQHSISFTGHHIMLFDRQSGDCIALGSLETL